MFHRHDRRQIQGSDALHKGLNHAPSPGLRMIRQLQDRKEADRGMMRSLVGSVFSGERPSRADLRRSLAVEQRGLPGRPGASSASGQGAGGSGGSASQKAGTGHAQGGGTQFIG